MLTAEGPELRESPAPGGLCNRPGDGREAGRVHRGDTADRTPRPAHSSPGPGRLPVLSGFLPHGQAATGGHKSWKQAVGRAGNGFGARPVKLPTTRELPSVLRGLLPGSALRAPVGVSSARPAHSCW